jgi:hypothetical protein
VRRHPSDREQRRRLDAYVTGTSDEERGLVMLALFGHAVIFLLLSAAEAMWVTSTAVRVWRRREAGLTQAARTGVHKPTLVGLLAAHALYELLRRAGVAKLDRRSIEFLAQQRGTSDP